MSLILHMSIKHGLFRYMKRYSSKYGATGFFLRQIRIHILKIYVLILYLSSVWYYLICMKLLMITLVN